MGSDNGQPTKFEGIQSPQHGLHVTRSAAGGERLQALWDWLLGPDSPTEPAAKESKVANGHSQGPHIIIQPSKEQNKEN
jgi:hypothetical protein